MSNDVGLRYSGQGGLVGTFGNVSAFDYSLSLLIVWISSVERHQYAVVGEGVLLCGMSENVAALCYFLPLLIMQISNVEHHRLDAVDAQASCRSL